MAARRKVVTTTVTDEAPKGAGPGSGRVLAVGAAEGSADDQDIDNAIEELGAVGAKCYVDRLDEQRNTYVRICTVDAAQISTEFMQKNFGGGKYSLRFRRAGQIDKVRRIEIDRRIPARIPAWLLEDPDKKPLLALAPARTARDEDEDSEREFKQLYRMRVLDLIEESDKLRARSNEQAQRSAELQMSMMQTMIESAKSLASARQGPAAQPFGVKEITDIITLTEKLRGGGGEAASIDKALTLIGKFRTMSDDFPAPEGEAKGGLMESLIGGLVSALAPMLAAGMQSRSNAPPPAAPPVYAPPPHPAPPQLGAAPSAPSPQPAAPAAPGAPAMPVWLTLVKGSLLEAAEEGRDPGEVADSLMTLAPRRFHGQIRENIMSDTVIDELIAVAPEFELYRRWLSECVLALREWFAAPGEDQPEDAG